MSALLLGIYLENAFSQNSNEWRDKVVPEVRAMLDRGEKADIIVVLREQADVRGAKNFSSKGSKAHFVLQALRTTALRTQANLNKILHENGVFANSRTNN